MDKILDPERLDKLFRSCLYNDEELPKDGSAPEGAVIVEGLMNKFGFHPGRLKETEEDVRGMLAELPDDFRKSGGGGMSFLKACEDRHGEQWTGEHRVMEQLFCLGMGLGLASYCMPRMMWGAFPGGMPYLVVDV